MRVAYVFLFASVTIFPTSVSYGQDPIPDFLRGDANDDRVVSVADSHFLFSFLFRSGDPAACLKALDANDNGPAGTGRQGEDRAPARRRVIRLAQFDRSAASTARPARLRPGGSE